MATATLLISRLFRLLTPAARLPVAAKPRLLSLLSKLATSSTSFSLLCQSPYHRLSSRRFTSAVVSATISLEDKLSEATLSYFNGAGELQTTSVSALTAGKKAILFAVPGAFTPTCSQKYLPGFVEKSSKLKAKGVDVIACVSVNNAFVMRAWKENHEVKDDDVLLLSNGNGDFTRP